MARQTSYFEEETEIGGPYLDVLLCKGLNLRMRIVGG